MADKEKDSERVPNFDGNAGLTFDVYEENILNYTAGKTDDRGWSCADYLTGVDEGGALGPAWPVGAATELRKAQKKTPEGVLRHHLKISTRSGDRYRPEEQLLPGWTSGVAIYDRHVPPPG
jgi:hypothetical protein